MAFDLKQPWATHRLYQVFTEKYNDLFANPAVTSHRIIMLHLMEVVVNSQINSISNTLVAKYALVRYAIIYMLRQILEQDESGKRLLIAPEEFIKTTSNRKRLSEAILAIVTDIIVELNHEMNTSDKDEDFDYRAKLRDEEWVKALSKEIVKSHAKDVARDNTVSFHKAWTMK